MAGMMMEAAMMLGGGMMGGGMGGGMAPPCELLDGPSHVNIVLNASPGCCCCGPSPIHPGYIQQRMGGAMGMMEQIAHVHGPEETINFNCWANPGGGSLPQPMQGRVDPSAWSNFVNALSLLENSQPGCFAQVCLCKCFTSGAEFDAALAQLEAAWAQPLGACGFGMRTYTYQHWVPYQAGSPATDQGPGSPDRPAHWENQNLQYLRIDLASAAPNMMAPGGMMQPGQMMQNPMMMQQQQQPMMMQQQQPMMMQPQQQGMYPQQGMQQQYN